MGFESPELALAQQALVDDRLPRAAAAYVRREDAADLIRFTIDDPGFAAEISVAKLGPLWYPLSYGVCD